MNSKYSLFLFSILLLSCTNSTISVRNEKRGKLITTHRLVQEGEKKIPLDYESAPKPPYMQMIYDEVGGIRILAFLNTYKNSICFYDYDKEIQIGETVYEKEGPNGILRLDGFYIENMDSIYVYNRSMVEVALTDSAGTVKKRISLRGNDKKDWILHFPFYLPNTVIPFIKINNKLILTGFATVSIPSQMIEKYPFTACIDTKTDEVDYMYRYPKELFGSDSNWEGGMSLLVYPELSPAGEIIHSFAVSHDLYIAQLNSNDYKSVYAGSNNASTINSINWGELETTPAELIFSHHAEEDMYTAIRYDPYRKVYYRILLQGINIINPTHITANQKKPIAVIIMDEQFNYLGETVIGTGEEWNWQNTFVTSEGLVMEYIDQDFDSEEEYLILKTFTVEKL